MSQNLTRPPPIVFRWSGWPKIWYIFMCIKTMTLVIIINAICFKRSNESSGFFKTWKTLVVAISISIIYSNKLGSISSFKSIISNYRDRIDCTTQSGSYINYIKLIFLLTLDGSTIVAKNTQMLSKIEKNKIIFCYLNILFCGLYQPIYVFIILSTWIIQVANINYLNNLTKDNIYIFSDFHAILGNLIILISRLAWQKQLCKATSK